MDKQKKKKKRKAFYLEDIKESAIRKRIKIWKRKRKKSSTTGQSNRGKSVIKRIGLLPAKRRVPCTVY